MSDSVSPPPPPSRPEARRVLPVIFLTVLLDLLGFGLVIPITPFYAQEFHMPPWQITLLAATYSIMQYLFMPVWGRLSDRIGRRPVILMSVAVSCVGYLLFGLASSVWVLFAARMLAGFGNANIGAAQAVIADTTAPHERARGMGMIGAGFGIGFVLGPIVGGVLCKYSLALPSFVAAGLGALNLVLAFFLVPETRDPNQVAQKKEAPKEALDALRKQPQVRRLLLTSLTVTTGFAMMEQVTGLFVQHYWRPMNDAMTAAERSLANREAAGLSTSILAAVGITMVLVQGGLIGRLTRRYGEGTLLRVGTLGVTIGLLIMIAGGTVGAYPLMFVASVILAAGSALNMPSTTSLLSRSASAEHQGGLLGLGQSRAALGRVAGPTMAGALFQIEPRLPLLVGAVLTAIAFVLTTGVVTPPQATPEPPRD